MTPPTLLDRLLVIRQLAAHINNHTPPDQQTRIAKLIRASLDGHNVLGGDAQCASEAPSQSSGAQSG